jgi:cytochrome c553
MTTSRAILAPLVSVLLGAPSTVASAAPPGVPVELGPITGSAGDRRTVVADSSALRQTTWYDVQDGHEHHVRGLPLGEFLARVKAPKAADAVVFEYADGMRIPVRLRDKDEVKAIFIAFEHGDAMERFDTSYPLLNKAVLPCPKVLYGRHVTTYNIWIYPGALSTVRLVTWKAYEAMLAQVTRRAPDRSGWPLYLEHCQPCHGLGGNGAKRAPDFLGDMEAYRRVPPLAVTDVSQQPSLHEKVKGFTEGTMPVLNHIPDRDIATLWRWLHAVHASAVK